MTRVRAVGLNKVVQIKNIVGRVIEVLGGGRSFVLLEFKTGRQRKYISSCSGQKLRIMVLYQAVC